MGRFRHDLNLKGRHELVGQSCPELTTRLYYIKKGLRKPPNLQQSVCNRTWTMTDKEHKCVDRNELLEQTKLNIDKFGLQVIMVSSTSYSPSFAYSIGLWETYKHPEIICFGLPDNLGHAIINDVAEMIKQGVAIKIGENYTDIFKDSRATFLRVDKRNIDDYFAVALEYYGSQQFEALQ